MFVIINMNESKLKHEVKPKLLSDLEQKKVKVRVTGKGRS